MNKKLRKISEKILKTVMKGKFPEITIERVGWNSETGEITFIDIHNESDGKAYFFENPSSHFHGFYKKKVIKKKKK